MITRNLRLILKQAFGSAENPVWQVAEAFENSLILSEEKNHDDQPSVEKTENRFLQALLPLDKLQLDRILKQNENRSNLYQTFVSEKKLLDSTLQALLESEARVQIWIDRIISRGEARILSELIKKYQTVELVYLPSAHHHPAEIFQNFPKEGQHVELMVHLKTKKSSFDRWLTPQELWDRILWLKQNSKFSTVEAQIFSNQINKTLPAEEILFLLNPTYQNLMFFLRTHHKSRYFTQTATSSILASAKPGVILFLRQFLGTVLQPTAQNIWLVIKHSRNFVLFYPIRKTYWFLEHAFRKRILGRDI